MPDEPADPAASSAAERLINGLHRPVHELPRGQTTRLTRLLRQTNKRVEAALFERDAETAAFAAGIEHFHPERVIYQPSGWRYLHRILRSGDVGSDDVFADMGCGKGRILMQARRYRFKRVVGVEVDDELAEIARINVAKRRRGVRAGPVEIVVADAAEYEIPDDLTMMYLYYPFTGETFRRVVANVEASLDRNPRRFRIVYALPVLEEMVLASGRFRLVRRKGGVLTEELRLYESG